MKGSVWEVQYLHYYYDDFTHSDIVLYISATTEATTAMPTSPATTTSGESVFALCTSFLLFVFVLVKYVGKC